MITPSPTGTIEPEHAPGALLEMKNATASRPAGVTCGIPNTSYEMHLRPSGEITAQPGKRLIGIIRAEARRIDTVTTGGRYVEPVMGRPRRVQGTVVRAEAGAIVVDAGVPIHCTPTDARQKDEDFAPGTMVSFDVLDGATIQQR